MLAIIASRHYLAIGIVSLFANSEEPELSSKDNNKFYREEPL